MRKPKQRAQRQPVKRKPHPHSRQPAWQATTPGSTLGDAPVTITVSQLVALQNETKEANARAAELEQQLAVARSADPAGRVAPLAMLVRNGFIPIMRFAIANLPPSEIPKWPWDAVAWISGGLRHMPDFSEDDQVLVTELRMFVGDIKEFELARARKRDEQIASAPTATEMKELASRRLVNEMANTEQADLVEDDAEPDPGFTRSVCTSGVNRDPDQSSNPTLGVLLGNEPDFGIDGNTGG